MTIEAMKQALEKAYLAGFNASGEGYNGEYPFGDKNQNPENDPAWCRDRDNALRTAIKEAEKQERNFCERCGKRLGGEDHIHTCTPPTKE